MCNLRNYLQQDMLVNILRIIKISNRTFVVCMIINTAIITINTIKTIAMPIISYFVYASIL